MSQQYKSNTLKPPIMITPMYNPFADKLPFFVIQMGEFLCGKGHYYEGFEQTEYIMIYTISGSANLKYRDKNYILNHGTLLILNGMDYHFYTNESDTPWFFRKIIFDGASANIFYNLINGSQLNIIDLEQQYFYDMFVKLIGYLNENSINSTIKASMEIFVLLSKCSEHSTNDGIGLTKDIKYILEHINANYNKKINLDTLMHFSNVSKCNLIKRFKKQIGFTPYKYILKVRLTKAKHLLRNTEKSVSQIAEDVGITDESSFIKHFKDDIGCTPNKYRKQNSSILHL